MDFPVGLANIGRKKKDLLISTPLHTSTLAFPLNQGKTYHKNNKKFLTNFKATETNNVYRNIIFNVSRTTISYYQLRKISSTYVNNTYETKYAIFLHFLIRLAT